MCDQYCDVVRSLLEDQDRVLIVSSSSSLSSSLSMYSEEEWARTLDKLLAV